MYNFIFIVVGIIWFVSICYGYVVYQETLEIEKFPDLGNNSINEDITGEQ